MKSLILYLTLTTAALACPPCGPENPPEPPRDTDHERPESQAVLYGCCIRDGVLEAKGNIFTSKKLALELCVRKARVGDRKVYECPDNVSPEALK